MTIPEPTSPFDIMGQGTREPANVMPGAASGAKGYDPELLYVECHTCGNPVIWGSGKTTELLLTAGVDLSKIDERCMIVSEGCPACSSSENDSYTLAVVRIAGLTPEEAISMSRPGGTA